MPRHNIRNVAIIAHVDHGKTTLVDQLLRQSGQFRNSQLTGHCILDSNPLERERGITIFSKNCAIDYTDRRGERFHINIVDTPGHADFSGEVERVMKMADGALLLVDAADGVMPQTRYVLSKALAAGLKPIVVINKMDRPDARPQHVLHQVFDLLVDLGSEDHALDFPVIYASGRDGWATADPSLAAALAAGQAVRTPTDIHDLFDAIIRHVPVPNLDANAPLQVLITALDYSDYVGRIGIGRVFAGTLHAGQQVVVIDRRGEQRTAKIGQVLRFEGLGRRVAERIDVGDLCAVVGLDRVDIGQTLADPANPIALPTLPIDEPTISMVFRINDGPFGGREGKYVTTRQLRERLQRELQSNVAMRLEDRGDEFVVFGRGLLHLGILLENMRREGYELTVGKPQVILRQDQGRQLEPIETVLVDVPSELTGPAMQLLGERRGELLKARPAGSRMHLEFRAPARGLIGLRSRLLNATGGQAILHHRFESFGEYRGPLPQRSNGVMIATQTGRVTAHALEQLADRGVMFVVPGDQIYEGQIVGEHCKANDIPVNATRLKKLTNVRQSNKEATVVLKAPRLISLEGALEYIEHDELVEITPKAIRLRKRYLQEAQRRRLARQGALAGPS